MFATVVPLSSACVGAGVCVCACVVAPGLGGDRAQKKVQMCDMWHFSILRACAAGEASVTRGRRTHAQTHSRQAHTCSNCTGGNEGGMGERGGREGKQEWKGGRGGECTVKVNAGNWCTSNRPVS